MKFSLNISESLFITNHLKEDPKIAPKEIKPTADINSKLFIYLSNHDLKILYLQKQLKK